jgi:hypothetical protein
LVLRPRFRMEGLRFVPLSWTECTRLTFRRTWICSISWLFALVSELLACVIASFAILLITTPTAFFQRKYFSSKLTSSQGITAHNRFIASSVRLRLLEHPCMCTTLAKRSTSSSRPCSRPWATIEACLRIHNVRWPGRALSYGFAGVGELV